MQVKKQQLEPDLEQQTGSKWGKEYIKAVYCHPAYLTYMQSISFQMPSWMNHKLESRLPGKTSTTLDMQIIPFQWQKGASLVTQMVKHLPAMPETRVWFLAWEDPLGKEMVIHSSTLAWKIPWTEKPDRLQSMGLQRVGHDWATSSSLSLAENKED